MNDNVKELFEKVKGKGIAAAEYAGKKAGSAGKKAGEIWNSTRMRMQIYDLGNELNAIYRQMGELVFAAHMDVNADTSAIDDLLVRAEEKINEINARRAKIHAAKQAGRCTNEACKKPIEKGDTYCRACGAAVETTDTDEHDDSIDD